MMKDIKMFDLEYVGRKQEFDAVYTFQFKPKEPLEYVAGQWVHIGFPTENLDKTMVRHMSFSSAPTDELVEFTMDVSSATPYKRRMEGMQPGDLLKAFKIKGNFSVHPSTLNEVVFVSGGIGITPVRSIVREFFLADVSPNWSLLHVSRDRFLYEEEFAVHTNQQLRVNRAQLDDVWDSIIDKPTGTQYYVSGSLRFVEGLQAKLLNSGISQEFILTEDFH